MRAGRVACTLCLCSALAGGAVAAVLQDGRGRKATPQWGRCEREAPALLGGVWPVKVGKKVGQPKKIRDARPQFPAGEVAVSSTVWAGEVLVDQEGKVHTIWVVRRIGREYDTAIEAAIRKWQYRPMLVDGAAVPFCMTVVTNINFQ